MKRTFIAIKIKPEPALLELLEGMQASLKLDRINWVGKENLHLTLKFLGSTKGELLPVISQKLEEISKEFQPLSIVFNKIGVFGSSYEPRVIWLGIEENEALLSLIKRVYSEMEILGFRVTSQNLVPHLTLGRVKNIQSKQFFQKTIDKYQTDFIQSSSVENFAFIESVLTTKGAVYKTIKEFPLV